MGGAWWTLGLAAALIAAVFVLAPVEAADDVWCVSLTSNTSATATPPTFPIDARGGGVVPNATVDAGSPCAASLGNGIFFFFCFGLCSFEFRVCVVALLSILAWGVALCPRSIAPA